MDYNGFNMRNNSFALALNGAYTFPDARGVHSAATLALLSELRPQRLLCARGCAAGEFWQQEVAAYVQDQFRPTSRLTIDMGLRYDAQLNPQPQAGIAGVQSAGRPAGYVLATSVQLTDAPVPQGIPDDHKQVGDREATSLTTSRATARRW